MTQTQRDTRTATSAYDARVSSVSGPAAPLRIELRGGFRLAQLNKLTTLLQPLAELRTQRELRLDLSGLVFIAPTCLTALVATLMDRIHARTLDERSHYIPPRNWLVDRYLTRIDFHEMLSGPQEEPFVRRAAVGFRPCRALQSADDLPDLVDSLTLAATEAVRIGALGRIAVWTAIHEIAKNVLDHSCSVSGGYAMAQRSRSRQEFEVAIADAGIGIQQSIRRNGEYLDVADDLEAIRVAMCLGATGQRGPNSGIGLTATRELLRLNGGTLVVRSGNAAIESGRIERGMSGLPHFRGTLVAMRMNTARPLTMEVFSQLANGPQAIPAWLRQLMSA